MNSNFIAGEFYFDAAQAPPFGLEQRLINLGRIRWTTHGAPPEGPTRIR